MKVTEVRLTKVEGDEKQLAFGSIIFDGEFVVNGIRLIQASGGERFVAFPSRKNTSGEYKDICFPIKRELREDITMQVIAKYENM